MLTMSGRKSCLDCEAGGRLTLMFAVLLISRLTIMNDASRKNMMSISGMMTIRDAAFGMGERQLSMAGGLAGVPACANERCRRFAAADHDFDIRRRRFQVKLQLRHLGGKIIERNQRKNGDGQSAGGGDQAPRRCRR